MSEYTDSRRRPSLDLNLPLRDSDQTHALSAFSESSSDRRERARDGFKREGKGDHEIWFSPITGIRFVVDHSIKSRHTANAVLKQAGLPK